MNTKVWGGPLWRVLHGTGQLRDRRFAPHLANVVSTLEFVMPCSFCRESYIQFSKDLTIDEIDETIASGNFARWLYDMHNKVVFKLQAQILEKARVPKKYVAAVLEESKLSFEVLQKRLRISVPYFSATDVFVCLGILALSAREGTCKVRKAHFLKFARSIAFLLTGFPVSAAIGTELFSALHSATVRNFNAIMAKLLQVELNRRPSTAEKHQHVQTLSYAKASSCTAGVCL